MKNYTINKNNEPSHGMRTSPS